MEKQDMDLNNQEDIESMLARAASSEKSILALFDEGCIIEEKYCSDGLFEEEDIKINLVR